MNFKNISIILLLCVSSIVLGLPASSYTTNSALSSGKWVKIEVSKSGVHKLTHEYIIALGLDPATLRVHGYGGALLSEDFNTTYIDDLPEVPTYNSGSFFLFVAQGPTSWGYKSSTNRFEKIQNLYSNKGYYFLTSGGSEGKKITTKSAATGTSSGVITNFDDYLVHELDEVSLLKSGREFYGENFNNKSSYYYQYEIPNIQASTATIRLDVASTARSITSFTCRVNGSSVGTLSLAAVGSSTYEIAKTAQATYSFLPTANNQLTVQLNYSITNTNAYLNFFEINYKRDLSFTSNELFFRNKDYINQPLNHTFQLSNSNSNIQIWDITNIFECYRVESTQSGTIQSFLASTQSIREYVAVDPNGDFPSPVTVSEIANQNLHGLSQVDYIIISHPDFLSEANRLAQAHRDHSGISVHVVNVNHIYNEFSSGNPDATAYRRFVKMFYDRANSNGTKRTTSLLLFGDGSFDNKNITLNPNLGNKLLTFQSFNSTVETSSYVSDDYFGFLDDSEETTRIENNTLDIGIGRFPVRTLEEAKNVVDKTITYMSNKYKGNWKNQCIFIADDGDGNQHTRDCDSVANLTQRLYPNIVAKKIFTDAFKIETSANGQTYPVAKKMFLDYVKFGSLMINFMGHGGFNGWTAEKILTTDDINNFNNVRLPLWVTATCGFSNFDSNITSGGESVLLNPNGGGIALFSTTRTVYASPNYYLNREFVQNVMKQHDDGTPYRLGEIMQHSKNKRIGDSNKMCFTLLGDPALVLTYPNSHTAKILTINDKSFDENEPDTIKALSEMTLKGCIVDRNGIMDASFNGYIQITVYDKEEIVVTNDNQQATESQKVKYRYVDRPNSIFNGTTEVVNGEYSMIFRAPKDIKYNFGSGRIVLYAADDENDYEANGDFKKIIVGGEDANAPVDTKGPEIQAYLNTPTFMNGSIVNENPLFVAKVYDESGINTVGTGIGHDIVLRLNGSALSEVNLNNYYTPIVGTYTEGTIQYKLENLPEGKHKIYFRIWDTQNNSSYTEINFEVVNGYTPDVSNITAYPNPAKNEANFVIEHDRPDALLDLTLEIFDISGRMVWKATQKATSQTTSPIERPYSSNKTVVTWDLSDMTYGGRVRNGIYIGRMIMSVDGGTQTNKSVKIIVQ